MNAFAAKLAAASRRAAHRIHRAQLQRFGGFVLLLAMVAWSYEMLTFVPAPIHAHTDAMPLAVAPQPADSGVTDLAPEPDPSANAIASFDVAPS